MLPKITADALASCGWEPVEDREVYLSPDSLDFLEVDDWGDHVEVTLYRFRSFVGFTPHVFSDPQDARLLTWLEAHR